MPALLVKNGAGEEVVLPIDSGLVRIGRDPACDVALDDRTVSREHAVLHRRGGMWYVHDVGSRNRVTVNGVPVASSLLNGGDEIRLGAVTLVFLEEGEERPAPPREQAEAGTEVTHIISLAPAAIGVAAEDQRLNHLLTLGELATTVKTVPALCDGVAASLQGMLGADRVIPILCDDSDRWRPYLSSRRTFGADTRGLGIQHSLIEQACREGPVAARTSGKDGGSIACVPLRVGVRNLGVLYCERNGGRDEFGDEDLRYLLPVGFGMGLMIEALRARQNLASRTRSLTRQLAEHYEMVGESESMKTVYQFIHRVAPTDAGVFICGESGTGKEMVARAIHRHSRRSTGPLEIVNCAAVPAGLVESELFGHVKGAFTGAVADRSGRFELADGGTLFLDEVGQLPLECQAKLLRVLEESRVRRIGDTEDRAVDVRLIAATNRDPQEAVADRELRADLFYRLDRLRVVLPPLRERQGDSALLAEHFRRHFAEQCKRPAEGFGPEALDVFAGYPWPGNVRELRNVVERMVILAEGALLGPELIPERIRATARDRVRGPQPLSEVEKDHIAHVLAETGGNKKRAAELLGIDRSTLYARLKKHGIEP